MSKLELSEIRGKNLLIDVNKSIKNADIAWKEHKKLLSKLVSNPDSDDITKELKKMSDGLDKSIKEATSYHKSILSLYMETLK